ncbi:nucleoporin NUP42-like, partial [Ruditapes philippinarum]|uniref:nucleoporin NUP42-like n=1 Tax=Ruditapes philippinarum TaxID=129788 RepID=UPI00295B7C1C
MGRGYSVTAQRQLFGGGGGGGGRRGGGGGGGQKVSFRDSFGQSQNQNPYRWLSQDAQQQQQQGRNAAANTQQMSAADIVKGLAVEVAQTWEGGNMWPFSCLGFEKDLPSLPGFMDISPEEMRLEAYEALKSGNIQPYVQKLEGAFNQLNTQRQELKNPNLSLKQKLISFIDDCRRKKNSG